MRLWCEMSSWRLASESFSVFPSPVPHHHLTFSWPLFYDTNRLQSGAGTQEHLGAQNGPRAGSVWAWGHSVFSSPVHMALVRVASPFQPSFHHQ